MIITLTEILANPEGFELNNSSVRIDNKLKVIFKKSFGVIEIDWRPTIGNCYSDSMNYNLR